MNDRQKPHIFQNKLNTQQRCVNFVNHLDRIRVLATLCPVKSKVPPPRCRIPRPGTAPTKTPTPAHPGGQTDTGARRGKKGPPTRPSPHHCPPCSPPTKGLRHGAPHRPGGASPPHHHRRPIHPRRPRTPLGPHNHPSDAPTTAGPQ